MNSRDEELIQRLAATLDSSIAVLDADTRGRLAAARHTALKRTVVRRVVGGVALAASIVALVLVPWSPRHGTSALDVTGSANQDLAYLSVDPQMLDDMDLLQGLDELQSGEGSQPQGAASS